MAFSSERTFCTSHPKNSIFPKTTPFPLQASSDGLSREALHALLADLRAAPGAAPEEAVEDAAELFEELERRNETVRKERVWLCRVGLRLFGGDDFGGFWVQNHSGLDWAP